MVQLCSGLFQLLDEFIVLPPGQEHAVAAVFERAKINVVLRVRVPIHNLAGVQVDVNEVVEL